MYYKHFELNEDAFAVTPNPDILFQSKTHKEALATIIVGVEHRKGFVAIIGDVGLGKTTVLQAYLHGQHGKDLHKVNIYNPNVTFDELLTRIFAELKLPPRPANTADAVDALHHVLIEYYDKDETVVLVIDEVQNMPIETLENLRMLSNLETHHAKLIQIVLCGQTEFADMLGEHRLRQLKTRITSSWTIQPLSRRESINYIEYRLSRAAYGTQPIMTSGAIRAIAEAAEGVPRVINILADQILIHAYGSGIRPVDAQYAKKIIAGHQATFQGTIGRNRRAGAWKKPAGIAAAVAGLLLMAGAVYAIPGLSGKAEQLFGSMVGLVQPVEEETAPPPVVAAPPKPSPVVAKPEPTPEPTPIPAPVPQPPPTITEQPSEAAAPALPEQTEQPTIPTYSSTPPTPVAESPAASNQPESSVHIIKDGDIVERVIRKHYGVLTPRLIQRVRDANPHISDLSSVVRGDRINLPAVADPLN